MPDVDAGQDAGQYLVEPSRTNNADVEETEENFGICQMLGGRGQRRLNTHIEESTPLDNDKWADEPGDSEL